MSTHIKNQNKNLHIKLIITSKKTYPLYKKDTPQKIVPPKKLPH